MYIRGANPGVKYHFLSPQKSEITADQVKWKIGDWDVCTEDCAGGTKISCFRDIEIIKYAKLIFGRNFIYN